MRMCLFRRLNKMIKMWHNIRIKYTMRKYTNHHIAYTSISPFLQSDDLLSLPLRVLARYTLAFLLCFTHMQPVYFFLLSSRRGLT